MFRFANPEYLYLLVLVPLLAVVVFLSERRAAKRRRRLIDDGLLAAMVPNYSPFRRRLKFVLLEIAVTFMVLMIARPQYGTVAMSTEGRGIEVTFVVDVSNSMMARDVQPNRLERSKLLVSTLIDKMKNDKVALAVFAGEAYPQLPITNDFASAKLFLDNFSTGMVTLQGTSVAAAINLGRISFTDRKDVGKAIVVITDGEDHEEGAVEAAREAAKEGFKVFVLGVGSPEGARIPLPDGSNLRDKAGNEVVTALNEKMCREVAEAGGGTYLHIDNSDTAGKLLREEFEKMQQADNAANFTDADEQFRAMALIVLILLLTEYFVRETKNPILKRLKIFR